MRRIYPRVSNKPLPNNAKGPLPVDVRRSTTLLLKLPNITRRQPRPQGAFPGFGDGAGKGPGRSHDHKRNPEFVGVIN